MRNECEEEMWNENGYRLKKWKQEPEIEREEGEQRTAAEDWK